MTIHILLADDHAIMRDGLRFLLEAEGDIQVVGMATDGQDAIRLVRRTHPDVVVMDIGMPLLNGIDATQQVRETSPTTQVVILSIHSAAEYVHRALKAGALGYLLKESAGDEVVAAVRAVHAGQRYLCQRIADTVVDNYLIQKVASPLEGLSLREREVLQLVAEGKSSNEIAVLLSLSQKTIETYRSRIMQKLSLSDMAALIKFSIRHGLISIDQ